MAIARTFLIATLLTTTATAALAQRAAMVIGNSSYQHISELPLSTPDARAVAQNFRDLGFEVIEGYDLDYDGMRDIQRAFAQLTNDTEIMAIYYSGQTLSVGGVNFLVPVDALLTDAIDWEYETYEISEVLAPLSGSDGAGLVMINSPKSEPQIQILASTIKELDPEMPLAQTALSRMEMSAGGGIAFLFSDTADAPMSGNSPFASAIVSQIGTPNTQLPTVLSYINGAFDEAGGGKGNLSQYGSLQVAMMLNEVTVPADPAPTPIEPQVIAAAPATAMIEAQKMMFEAANESQDPADYRALLDAFPQSPFAQLARNALQRIEEKQAAAAPVQTAAAALTATRTATPQPQATVAPNTPVQGAISSVPMAITAAVPAGAAPQAAMPTTGPLILTPSPALVSKPATQQTEIEMALSRDQKREVQQRLNAMDHIVGNADGVWGKKTRAGLSAWQTANRLIPTGFLSASQFELMRANSESVYQAYLATAPVRKPSSGGGNNNRRPKACYKSTGLGFKIRVPC